MKNRFLYRFKWMISSLFVFTFLFFSCHPKKYKPISVISAVPASSSVFFKINDPLSLSASLGKDNNWWKLLGNIDKMKPLKLSLSSIDSLYTNNSDFNALIKGKEVVISLFLTENNDPELLAIIPVDLTGEQKKAENLISGYIKQKQFIASKQKYNRVSIFNVKSPDNEIEFIYAFHNKFLIIAQNQGIIETTIDHLQDNNYSIPEELAPLLKTTNNQAQINIFINHSIAFETLSIPLSTFMKERITRFKDYSGWSELDLTIKNEKVILSGFTNGDLNKNYFTSVFQNQQPGISKIEGVLPSNTAFFSGYYISNIERFFTDLNSFHLKREMKPNGQTESIQKLFSGIFDGEIARAGIFNNESDNELNTIIAIKTKSGSFALNKMEELSNLISPKDEQLKKEYKIDSETKITIYKAPHNNFTTLLFGDLFEETKTNWYTVFDNYLFFSNSYEGLGKVILSNILGETLLADNDYNKYQSSLSSKNNYYFYCNSSISYIHSNLFFNESISKNISSIQEFRKFRHFSWQISSSKNMVYNNSSIIYDENIKFKPKPIWQSHLNAPLLMRPLIIENKYDMQNIEIVLFDINNNLYLLNNVGRIVWQQNTGSPILGDISIVDIDKKGEHQLVFNTKEKLFIIDKKGNTLPNFPVNFKVNASNGVAVFDYENTRNYRFFVACNDQLIYAYDSEGNAIEGWQEPKTDHIVTQPVQHFTSDGKDYIVASDRMKDYIFDRKGNIRVPTDFVYNHSNNNKIYFEQRTKNHEPRMAGTDTEGNIHYTYFDGQHEMVSFNQLDENHYFLAANIDGDQETEYIMTHGPQLIVIDNEGSILFSDSLSDQAIEKPFVFNFTEKDKKIGVSSTSANKVYLFNKNYTLYKEFPLDGCTPFNIGFINDDKSRFNLYVGSIDACLFNYLIQ